jgi:cytochrome c oxidase subunit 2
MRHIVLLCLTCTFVAGCEREAPTPAEASAVTEPAAASVGAVAVMDEETLDVWAQKGRQVWQAKTCFMCHSLKGAPLAGPSPIGVWGSRQKLADGREMFVDEAYIRESILNPAAAITAGYPNQMLSFQGHITDEEITAVTALFRTLKDGPAKAAAVPSVPATKEPPR